MAYSLWSIVCVSATKLGGQAASGGSKFRLLRALIVSNRVHRARNDEAGYNVESWVLRIEYCV